jgi:transcriptional regulator with GAF, ATPase, and Fis domain
MQPILLQVAGTFQGKTFKLVDGETTIGREPSNSICIPDSSLSRRHCLIRRASDNFTIVDLESRNGTFVNELPAKERVLQHGDQIAIGNNVFVFLLHESPSQRSIPDEPLEDEWIARSTVEIRSADSVYLRSKKVSDTNARGFASLLKISTIINSQTDEATLLRELLELIVQEMPIERAAILLGHKPDALLPIVVIDKDLKPISDVRISRSISRKAYEQNLGILSNDVQQNENLAAIQSLVSSKISSLIAVPISALDQTLGVIYGDQIDPKVQFSDDHLQWLSAVAVICAIALLNVRRLSVLEKEKNELLGTFRSHRNMIGESSGMLKVFELISKVASTNSTVLIRGESGTGKELVARAIHMNSPRASKPFVAINCSALPEFLLESELFGHEKGAFTGAISQKKGKLEVAEGGTVFLDEIGEIPTSVQVKLLRILQEHEFDRVGGTRPIKTDVRFVAATNKNLEQAILEGSFRKDLFYRLNVVTIDLPPLRERREDIPLLTTYFAKKFCQESKKHPIGIASETRAWLNNYDWPGNVRELQNVIERAIVLTSNDVILPEDLPESLLENGSGDLKNMKYHAALRDTKRNLLLKAIEQAGGNYSEAARNLGIQPNNFHRLARSLNIKL